MPLRQVYGGSIESALSARFYRNRCQYKLERDHEVKTNGGNGPAIQDVVDIVWYIYKTAHLGSYRFLSLSFQNIYIYKDRFLRNDTLAI